MKIKLNLDWVDRLGHLEGNIDFSLKEKEELKDLLIKLLNLTYKLTQEEDVKLENHLETVRDDCYIVVDD